MMLKLSALLVSGPKFMVPRHNRLTSSPVRPRWVYFVGYSLSLKLCPFQKILCIPTES